jgi:hypothetical protein
MVINMTTKQFIVDLMFGMMMMIFGVWIGHSDGVVHMEKKAIEAGVGQYVIIDKTNAITKFEWITNTNSPQR